MTYQPLVRTVVLIGLLLCSFITAAQRPSTPIAGKSIPRFVDPLPLLDVTTPGHGIQTVAFPGTSETTLKMCEFKANVLPSTFVPANGPYTGTWVWGYRVGDCPAADAAAVDSYIGPVFVTERDVPTQIKFVNALPDNPHVHWRDWTDQTLHWADPLNFQANHCAHGMAEPDCSEHYMGPVAVVPHLHGAETPPVLDGGPNSWFTSDGVYHGNAYYSMDGNTNGNYAIYRYLDAQEAAPLWFHDHLLGGTRLNVYAGLAGAYVITDPSLHLPIGLHPAGLQQGAHGSVDYLIPLVLQDRMFDADGQLFFPNEGNNPTVHPFWVPEFVGDTIVVNGKVWPRLEVQPRRYRFLFINGSNARTYELWLDNPSKKMGPAIWQIAADGGYLEKPVKVGPGAPLQKLRLMPGERADVIIDFAANRGQMLILRNNARTPYPKGEPPNGATLGQVLQIVVGSTAVSDMSYDPATLVPIRDATHPLVRLVNPAIGTVPNNVHIDKIRELTLNEVVSAEDEPLEILVNNTKWDGMQIAQNGSRAVRNDFTAVTIGGLTEYYSELPDEGTTELWEIVNLTADAHPIHTHLTQFQLLNRQTYNLNKYRAAYAAAFPGGAYLPAFGPPRDYDKSTAGSGQKYGGNPNVDPYLQGEVRPPDANEAGWKDTVMMPPGMVTRFMVRYAPTSKALDDPDLFYPFDPNVLGFGYVWHCHIIDHEDNEMMRPYAVKPKNGITRIYVQGSDY